MGDEPLEVVDAPGFVRRLDECAEEMVAQGSRLRIADLQVDAERLRAPAQDRDRLRKAGVSDEEARRADDAFEPSGLDPVQKRHRFGRGRRLVQQRRIGDLHSGQVAHHRLKIEESFQPSLCDFGLIRRVGGVPAGVLEHVASNDAGRHAVVIPEPDVRPEYLVARGNALELAKILLLGDALGQIQWLLQADPGGNGLVDERVHRRSADPPKHLLCICPIRPDVSGRERVSLEHVTSPEPSIDRRPGARQPRPDRRASGESSSSREDPC